EGVFSAGRFSVFSVLDGATASDEGVVLGGSGEEIPHAVVDGAGSLWSTGGFFMGVDSGFFFPPSIPGLAIMNGGRVESTEANLRTQTGQRGLLDWARSNVVCARAL